MPQNQTFQYKIHITTGDALGVMVFVIRNRIGDPSSNPGQDYLHFSSY